MSVTGDCILWTGHLKKGGYGQSSTSSKRYGTRYIHRIRWIEAHGPIPDGMTIDHLCWNPACVNVNHMALATRSDNAKRSRRAMKTHCVNGHLFDKENTRPRKSGGVRTCKTCQNASARKYKAKIKAMQCQSSA